MRNQLDTRNQLNTRLNPVETARPPVSQYQDKHDPWSSHTLIREWLSRFPEGTRVLDVGTATGTLGRLCQGLGLDLSGLEPNSQWAEFSRRYYRQVLTSSLEDAPPEFLAGYQVVVCGDVLEHIGDPGQPLKRLVDLQAPGTVFIISVPNIANLWVRVNLLFGRFNYAERGILDRTHRSFFTRTTFVNMMQSAGLAVKQVKTTTVPLPLVSPFFANTAFGRLIHRALARLTVIMPGLLGYQFVAEAVKPDGKSSKS